jgi:pSer/pThr/pTyr-binding forkhead associated (FHA) protein
MFERVILRAMTGKFKGQELALENGGDYILGRARECACVLDDPLHLVSRRHCRIKVHAPLVSVQDLGSRNGTLVNGTSIGCREKAKNFEEFLHAEYKEVPLEDGDTLDIAGYEFEVEFQPNLPCAGAESRDQEKLWTSDCAVC